MLQEWKKFVGWKVLEHFLAHPTKEFYIKELARILKISPRSAHIYCLLYEKDNILSSERKANARMFKLNNELSFVKSLKKMYFLAVLNESGVVSNIEKKNPEIISLAIYGSYSSGTYDEMSDLDIFVLSDKKINRESVVQLEKHIGKKIQLTEFSLAQWTAMKNKREVFTVTVLANNTLLHGVEL